MIPDTEHELKEILGSTYGGPSVSIEGDQFVLYEWGDAPVSELELARGYSLEEMIKDYKEKNK